MLDLGEVVEPGPRHWGAVDHPPAHVVELDARFDLEAEVTGAEVVLVELLDLWPEDDERRQGHEDPGDPCASRDAVARGADRDQHRERRDYAEERPPGLGEVDLAEAHNDDREAGQPCPLVGEEHRKAERDECDHGNGDREEHRVHQCAEGAADVAGVGGSRDCRRGHVEEPEAEEADFLEDDHSGFDHRERAERTEDPIRCRCDCGPWLRSTGTARR